MISDQTRLLAGVGLCLAALAAEAAPVVFFGENQAAGGSTVAGAPVAARAAFLADLTPNVTSEGFESFPNGTTPPLTLTFQGSSSPLVATLTGAGTVFDTPALGRFNTTPGGSKLFEVTGAFSIDFATAISAFGFYGTDIGDFNGRVTVTLTDVAGHTVDLTVPNTINGTDGSLLFWGFIDPTTAYTRITFGNTAGGTDVFGFDDLVIGDLGQLLPRGVPEPATLALVVFSLGALGAVRRRNKQRT